MNIRWGIIGCGDVTEIKSGPAFNLIRDSKLVAVMRRDKEKARDYAHRHNVARWYSDVEAILSDSEINSIYIATPPSTHMEYAIKALERNLNVYLEKPIALNMSEAMEIADAVRKSKGKLSVAHYRRKLSPFRYIKEVIDSHAIGEIRFTRLDIWQSLKPAIVSTGSSNWRTDPAISGGGYFHDLSPHQLDLMVYYFGHHLNCKGYSFNQSNTYKSDDIVAGLIHFPDSVVFSGTWCFNSNSGISRDECIIVGSKGTISFSLFGSDIVIADESGKKDVKHFNLPEHVQQPMIESVVNYFIGTEQNPCDIEEGIEVIKIMDELTRKDK